MRPLVEGYYVESNEGLLFTVKGLVHPPQAVVAYLRYAPHSSGERKREAVRYRRLYRFEDQKRFLQERYPNFLFFDPIFGEQLQGVPREHIGQIYNPCLKLAELRQRGDLDELEERAVEFARLLVQSAGVPEECIGVSGSILLNLHTPRSDIDIVIYGSEYCKAVQGSLRELLNEATSGVRRLDKGELRALYALRSLETPMDFDDFAWLERHKVFQGKFRDCEYFIRFVKAPSEVTERYGERRYISLGPAEVQATIIDASEAIFTPCTYKIEDVRLSGTQHNAPLREIVSFRGRFCEQASEGKRVIARGKQEKVITKEMEAYCRLLIGVPGDFMATI